MPTTRNRPLTLLEEFLAVYELDRERSLRTRRSHRPITLPSRASISEPRETAGDYTVKEAA